MTKVYDTAYFVERARKVHGGKYDYSKSIYKNAMQKVVITCPEHGDFKQSPNNHINSKQGCPECGGTGKKNTRKFISKSIAKHGNKYDYSKTKYKTSREHVVITCKEHGDFLQAPDMHLRGRGCPKCKKSLAGWNRTTFTRNCVKYSNGLGTLYVIKFKDTTGSYYKVGITSKDVKTRFCNKQAMPFEYQVVYEIKASATYIFNIEPRLQELLKDFKVLPSEKFDGYTECFTTIKPIENLLKELSSTEQLQLLA